MKKHNTTRCVWIILLLSLLLTRCFLSPEEEEEVLVWTTAFIDNFDRANNTDISPFSLQVYGDGSADIFNEQLRYGGNICWAIRHDAGVPGDTIRVSATCTVQSGAPYFGISAKSRNLGSEWQNQELYAFWISADSIGLYEITQQSPTCLVRNINPCNIGNPVVMTLVVMNKNLKGYIEDTVTGVKDSVVGVASFHSSGTIAGFNGSSAATDTVLIDNFKIETGSMIKR